MLALTEQGKMAATNIQGKGPEYTVLSTLYESSGPVDFDEIVDKLGASQETASLVVRRLMKNGLVKEV